MQLNLHDGTAALAISRWLLALALVGGIALQFVPFGDRRSQAFTENSSGMVAAREGAGRGSQFGNSNRDHALFDRDLFSQADAEPDASRRAQTVGPPPIATVPTGAAGAADVPQLIGTIIDRVQGSFAICALGSSVVKSVRVGAPIGSYRVDSVGPGVAVLTDSAGHSLTLHLKPRS